LKLINGSNFGVEEEPNNEKLRDYLHDKVIANLCCEDVEEERPKEEKLNQTTQLIYFNFLKF